MPGEVYASEAGKNRKPLDVHGLMCVVSDWVPSDEKSDSRGLPRDDTCGGLFSCHSAVYRCVRTLSQICGQRGARNTEMFVTFAGY